ncbi:MAG: adenylate/guanylate cyclase domain-containing protein [Treponema sp.]|jgi:class 3 adenylate cyclase/CHASE2 domain-containing sensor protein|nr:adenylate/guanylate cyclase domain-containing protein [Treponema sp.]
MSKPLLSDIKNHGQLYAFAASLVVVFLLALTGLFSHIDSGVYDIVLRLKVKIHPVPLNPRIIRVDLNDSSEYELGDALNSREAFGDLLTVLGDCGAKPVFDIIFRQTSQNDAFVAETASISGNTVLAVIPVPEVLANFAHDDLSSTERELLTKHLWHIKEYGINSIPSARTFIMSNPEIASAADRFGHIGVEADSDGVYRGTPLFYRWEDGVIPSLALAAVVAELGIDPSKIEFHPNKYVLLPIKEGEFIRIPVDLSGTITIPYSCLWVEDSYRISFAEIVSAQHNDEIFEKLFQELNGTIALVADITTSKKDFGVTPLETVYPLSGIHASVMSGILNEMFYSFVAFPAKIAIILLCLAAAVLISFSKRDWLYHTGFLFLLLFYSVLVFILWFFKGILPWYSMISAGIILLWSAGFIVRLLLNYREKFQLHLTCSRYLSEAVMKEVMDDPEKLKLGGERRFMTAMFTDIRGFSTISEKLADPVKLVELLNFYLTGMSDILMDNQGTIDKYEGDAIIGFFGAPITTDKHAEYACRSAILMKKKERALNEEILDRKLSHEPLFTRIGINSGDMVVGNMGTRKKMDYTIMGNAVNLASRLEGVNKLYNTGGILISEYTKEFMGNGFICRFIDRIRVVGVNTPLKVYELLDVNEEVSPELAGMVREWEKAMAEYESRNYKTAFDMFNAIYSKNKTDGVAEYFLMRCGEFLKKPPPESWDGVNNLTSK